MDIIMIVLIALFVIMLLPALLIIYCVNSICDIRSYKSIKKTKYKEHKVPFFKYKTIKAMLDMNPQDIILQSYIRSVSSTSLTIYQQESEYYTFILRYKDDTIYFFPETYLDYIKLDIITKMIESNHYNKKHNKTQLEAIRKLQKIIDEDSNDILSFINNEAKGIYK